MVGTGGFEPPTSAVSRRRSPTELRAILVSNDANSIPIWAEGVNRLALVKLLVRRLAIVDFHPEAYHVGFDTQWDQVHSVGE